MVFIWYLHRRNNGGETNLQGAFLRTRNSRKKRKFFRLFRVFRVQQTIFPPFFCQYHFFCIFLHPCGDVSESEEGNKIDLWFLIGFEGRVGRSLYIFVTAIYILLGFAVSSASTEMSRDDNPNSFVLLILSILGLTLWYIWIAQAVKRSHDIGHSGWWIWIPFYIVWLLFARGDEGENEYGNEPA